MAQTTLNQILDQLKTLEREELQQQMALYFLDSSALVKRYISETGSAWVLGLFDPALNNEIFIAAISSVEIVAAITRRSRSGSISVNVFISALLNPNGTPIKVIDLAVNQFMILQSESNYQELETRLSKKKFDKYLGNNDRLDFLSSVKNKSLFIDIVHKTTFTLIFHSKPARRSHEY